MIWMLSENNNKTAWCFGFVELVNGFDKRGNRVREVYKGKWDEYIYYVCVLVKRDEYVLLWNMLLYSFDLI